MTSLPRGMPLPMPLQTLLWVRYPTQVMEYCRQHYGAVFTLALPPFRLVMISDPEAIRTIFAAKTDDMRAGQFNRVLRVLVGEASVLLLDGAEHVRHRKLLMPSFHGERMRFYGDTMAEVTRRTIAEWPEDTPFVMHTHTQEITLQIILRTVFGADEGAQLTELHDQIKRMLKPAETRLSFVPLLWLSGHPDAERYPPWSWALRQRDRVDALLYRQIAARRVDQASLERKDVLAMLLQARDEDGAAMTDEELRDELVTALAAGHETTATSLAWAFERILSHPKVHARLREEVRALGSEPDPERLATLPYLDATIKEVLRLRPVIPVVGRVLQRPYTLAGHDLPAGASIGACIYLAQRDPEVYPEPEAFRPERFLGVQPDPAAWLPFGGGIRRCVGAAFAQYEMKIVLGTMLAACDFELAQPAPAKIMRRAITFWPEGGTRVRVRRRAG
jgi:cytochrome P450